ncbi:MAG: monodechloroaminopyrrolnitrin synthase PrnB family protein [Actinophytocola sp.]|uniref:monodechloroaminopyrrolnitrin synthase PrnB family protein n=1 Tax=Actinophytocola sp. TaxID=1872138 RepID=UPI003C7066B3
MSAVTDFTRWLSTDFLDANTGLEEAYFALGAEIANNDDLDQRKRVLRADGAALVTRIDGMPGDPYDLLGAVGLYLAACRRHEVNVPEAAQAVAGRLGLALGVAPRFVFAHLSTHNPAARTFTHLPDEHTFITCNGLAVLAYQRAAAALRRIPSVTKSLVAALYDEAHTALAAVLAANQALARTLDPDRFFRNIRPYFKPHPVCGTEYRGANAGDFAAVNEIDLALGLCEVTDPFYQRILAEKYPYLPPEDQPRLRTPPSNLRSLVERDPDHVEKYHAVRRAHGAAYAFHHHRLVMPFLARPAESAPQDGLTASGPPLEVVLATLSRLVDLRTARDRGLRK